MLNLAALPRLAQGFVDFATIFGMVGTIATLIGLWLTWRQAREAKRVAEAARDAALATAQADRAEFSRFVIAACHHLAGEAKIYVDERKFGLAAVRMADLADQLALAGRTTPAFFNNWESSVATLRGWEETFKNAASSNSIGPLKQSSLKQWHQFLRALYATIDRVHGPFTTITEEVEL